MNWYYTSTSSPTGMSLVEKRDGRDLQYESAPCLGPWESMRRPLGFKEVGLWDFRWLVHRVLWDPLLRNCSF